MGVPVGVPAEGRGLILIVCTGNVCRSPYIEHLLRSELAKRGIEDIDVTSRGTGALRGHPVAGPMARLMATEGLRSDAFTARQLEPSDARGVDLVITAERAHRSAVARVAPRSLSKIFTLRQLDRLLSNIDLPPATSSGTPVERLREIVGLAAAARGVFAPSADSSDDVIDPWQQTDSIYVESVAAMREPILRLADALTPVAR